MSKTKAPPNGQEPRPKQQRIPGTEPPSIPLLDQAAARYVEARDDRMRLLKTEIERHDSLLALMLKEGLTHYEYDGATVAVVNQQKVKVKRPKEEEIDE